MKYDIVVYEKETMQVVNVMAITTGKFHENGRSRRADFWTASAQLKRRLAGLTRAFSACVVTVGRYKLGDVLDRRHELSEAQMRTAYAAGVWEPNEISIRAMSKIIAGVCALWPPDESVTGSRVQMLKKLAEERLSTFWGWAHRRLPKGHEAVCAKAYWDKLATTSPLSAVCTLLIRYGEDLNPDKKAAKVTLIVIPAFTMESIELNILPLK